MHTMMQQVIITSSFAPIRLWRVQANARDYCTTLPDGSRACASDVASGFALNDAMAIPIANGEILASVCLGSYDLWVESLEYYDDLNIAVSVRRGGASAIYAMYSGHDTAPLERGTTVTYFVNTQNTSQVSAAFSGSPFGSSMASLMPHADTRGRPLAGPRRVPAGAAGDGGAVPRAAHAPPRRHVCGRVPRQRRAADAHPAPSAREPLRRRGGIYRFRKSGPLWPL